MGTVVVIGTSHIAQQSVVDIEKAIEKYHPDFVAVELDKQRLQALLSGEQSRIRLSDIRKIGFKGFLFVLIGQYVQRKLGNLVGMQPGADMLEAVQQARKKNIPVVLIDRNISVTLQRFSTMLSWKERFRFLWDILRGLFLGKRELKKYRLDTLDLRTVPTDTVIEKMIGGLKERYPNVYHVLLSERNDYMIARLDHVLGHNPDSTILAVVGAGHKKAIQKAFIH